MAPGGKKSGKPEKVAKVGLQKEPGFLYYLDKRGDISRAKMVNADAPREPPPEPPQDEKEFLALGLFGEKIKIVSITSDGNYKFLDSASNLHNIRLPRISNGTVA